MFLFRLVTLAVVGVAVAVAARGAGHPARAADLVSHRQHARRASWWPIRSPSPPRTRPRRCKIGTGLREEMKDVVGRDYQVVEQTQMNDALKQYGYPMDAILSPALATTLAKNIQARFVVNSTLNKGEGGRYTVTARLVGVNDDAGNVVTLTQNAERDAGGVRQAAGRRRCEPAVKSLADAKACIEQRTAKPDKAAERGQQGASRRCPTTVSPSTAWRSWRRTRRRRARRS